MAGGGAELSHCEALYMPPTCHSCLSLSPERKQLLMSGDRVDCQSRSGSDSCGVVQEAGSSASAHLQNAARMCLLSILAGCASLHI